MARITASGGGALSSDTKAFRLIKDLELVGNEIISPRPLREREQLCEQSELQMRVRGKKFAEQTDKNLFSSKKVAFTLAEVLITLGIIGVVAAMTIPSLVAEYKEKRTVTQLKKNYSVLQQAYLSAVQKHGDPAYWDLVVTSDGTKDEDDELILDYSGTKLLLSYLAENLNVQPAGNNLALDYVSLDGNSSFQITKSAGEYMKLNDGTLIVGGWINNDGYYPRNADLQVYFPGCEKRGCKLGVDIFYFKILLDEGKVIPAGAPSYKDTVLYFKRDCNLLSSATTNGRGCTAWVLINENMDYLHCNDLSWDGKHKCK